jgi:signal transduction histidine kinase/ActR/RegA family two-component response regulator
MLLVVDVEQRPLGLLRLERLMPSFGHSPSARQRSALAQPLQDWISNQPEGLEPVQVWPLPTSWAEMAQSLDLPDALAELSADLVDWMSRLTAELLKPDSLETTLVAVDGCGRALGNIDKLRLLQHQLHQMHHPLRPTDHPAADSALVAEGSEGPENSDDSSSSRATPALEPVPHPLLDLLERLPLPLMLQTATGHVISQNLAWRQQIGLIQHPQQIRRAAAQILETALSCRTDAKQDALAKQDLRDADLDKQPEHQAEQRASDYQTSDYRTSEHRTSGHRTSEQPATWSTHRYSEQPVMFSSASALPASTCQFGTEPNTCICVCPMQDGQERVWQFIKIPMGTAALEATDSADASGQEHQSPFKLASLKFNPVPNWQNLMQSAQLWLIWAQDVTEQQQVAQELAARNADLVQLNRLKDEFLACISHELKTPLTAVLGMSSLLKDHMIGDLNERQSHYAQLIYRGGRHLIAIVNNILDLTRTETGQLELLLEQIHIPRLCQQAYEQSCQILKTEAVNPETANPVLNFQLEVQPELRYIVADEMRLKQMLMNLLSNAIKFTEPGQPLGLRVENWEGWIAFTVWDSGVGIPAEKQHLIFQKFQQLEDPLTRQFQGTGLGLVLTQQLARLHGGEVTFTSVAGQGSQFTLLLPPVPPQASEINFDLGSPLPAEPSPDHNRLVLLVEADAHQLQERLEQLSELGYRPVVARSGTEAIEKARRLQPAAILLNPALPQLSGWDVLTLLKADSKTQAIPLVVTAVRVQKDQAYQSGADSFLNLPLETSALKRCFDRLIHVPPPSPASPTDLTVLHLSEGTTSLTLVPQQQTFTPGLTHLLHPYHCRVLEVDNLEQADLLVRVWKPDVVLIDQIQTDLPLFIQQLRNSALAKLPLISLSPELTRIASHSGLTVFHYPLAEPLTNSLSEPQVHQPQIQPIGESMGAPMGESMGAPDNQPHGASSGPHSSLPESSAPVGEPNLSELVQMMQLAAGLSWVPHVLIADCAGLERDLKSAIRPPVRALVQYLQTAGFRSAINHDWAKIRQKLNQQSVDLLLLCVSSAESPATIEAIARTLEAMPQRPPILVWCYQAPLTQTTTPDQGDCLDLMAPWQSVATRILPTSVSILELLAAINQTLAERRQPQKTVDHSALKTTGKPARKPTGPTRG